tara:strand:- start:969 stop:1235 length:267 start_codon:yes stop_codon:yes gene_type:complete
VAGQFRQRGAGRRLRRANIEFADEQFRIWTGIVQKIPDGGKALVVTHGLFVEAGAIASLPEADHGSWGGAIGYCEGVRLTFDGTFENC